MYPAQLMPNAGLQYNESLDSIEPNISEDEPALRWPMADCV